MNFDLKGYLDREPLAVSRPLLPLFEAVVNAFESIEESRQSKCKIAIHIERDQRQQDYADGEIRKKPILGFRVEDNGVGFTDENFASFETSFSLYKKSRGGKGIGRFTWLQAFEETIVDSIYEQGGKWYQRKFPFSIANNGVGKPTVEVTDITEPLTVIHLKGFKQKYVKECPAKADTIAMKILEHCLFKFLSTAPSVTLTDDDEKEPISLNELFTENVSPFASKSNVSIANHNFKVRHLMLYGNYGDQHSIHLCADKRDVEQVNLAKRIPSLSRKLEDENKKTFYYQCYVEGDFLNARANQQRTAFDFAKNGELNFEGEVSRDDLIEGLILQVKSQLGDHLDKLYDNIKRKAEQLVSVKYPEFHPMLKEFDTYVDEFSQDATEEQLLRKFNDLHFARDIEARQQAEQLLAKAEKGEYDQAYQDLFEHYFESVDDTASVNLSRYVIHRKAILSLLRKNLDIGKDGKYTREDVIHDIIFPRRRSSDEIDYHRWNLWIIDEKLAFHFYLSSDRPIADLSGDSDHRKEPDITVINNPAAFADAESSPIPSVVIIEFKRPERSSYANEGEDKNPIDQVQGYVDQIRAGKEVNIRGRRLIVKDNTPFYCYVIADLTPKLRAIADGRGFTPSPDELGYFWFNPRKNAYIELIDFNKLVQDAEQRNAALFKKLGLH